jgi:uncharacterized membrane protein YeaQ/YmgE (transglycosylase-associated protein family)
MDFLYFILIGAAAGWLGGQFMKGSGFGLLGLSSNVGLMGSLVTSTVGAIVLLYLARLVKK